MFIVEYRESEQDPWQRWGFGNTRRTANVSAASAVREYGENNVRIRKES